MKPIVTILISLFMLPNIMIGQSFSKAEQEVIEGVKVIGLILMAKIKINIRMFFMILIRVGM